MEYLVLASLQQKRLWLHEPEAFSPTIAGIDIHMFAKQARRAMIRKTAPLHSNTAMLAHEILFFSLKLE